MIISKTPVTLGQVKDYVKDVDNKVMEDYIKAFAKISKDDTEKCTEEIKALNNPKIKEETIVKIIDFVPKDSEDLNKIFLDVGLTDEESNSILAIVKKY